MTEYRYNEHEGGFEVWKNGEIIFIIPEAEFDYFKEIMKEVEDGLDK